MKKEDLKPGLKVIVGIGEATLIGMKGNGEGCDYLIEFNTPPKSKMTVHNGLDYQLVWGSKESIKENRLGRYYYFNQLKFIDNFSSIQFNYLIL